MLLDKLFFHFQKVFLNLKKEKKMSITQRRKAAIEDLFDRYYQRGDVDTITVSTIPVNNNGIQLLLSCPSMHGLQRTHEAYQRAHEQAALQNKNNGIDVDPNANGNIIPTNTSPYLADTGETEEDRREKHVVRCGVETILQLAKFKQASLDSQNSSVTIHSQYSNFLLTQFIAGPLLVTLSARRTEGRSLGLLLALANEIKGDPVFKQFVDSAIETRL
jgi:hypothetical protein